MASSNRHWPSLFKSKASHHPWHHDINSSIISSNATSSHKPPLSSSSSSTGSSSTEEGGGSTRTPEPKPRWNPRPEQIRILESIFNSGTVNPSRDDIRKIRGQLQEYGQVGDANVFYWFQNRKSRTKHKQQRHHQQQQLLLNNKPKTPPPPPPTTPPPPPTTTPPPLISSSSTSSSLQYYSSLPNFHQNDFLKVPILPSLQGFSSLEDHRNVLLSDLLLGISSSSCSKNNIGNGEEEMMKIQQQLLMSYDETSSTNTTVCPTTTTTTTTTNIAASASASAAAATLSSTIHHTQCDMGILQCPIKSSIVFINDVEFEVTMSRPFNVREAFGDDAILIHASGQPVITNEWGVALEPLHHGGFYYLIRTGLSHSSDLHTTVI